MKNILFGLIGIGVIGGILFFVAGDFGTQNIATNKNGQVHTGDTRNGAFSVFPISHATLAMQWWDSSIYVDPVGGAAAFSGRTAPDLILLTDIHGDHLSIDTLEAVITPNTTLIAPQAVIDELPETLRDRATAMANGDSIEWNGFTIEAMPMYNLPDQGVEIRHEKGRGNGYVISQNGYDVYIAGDTADIPEMRALEGIDVAFVPMNMPYTMSVEDAASGVLAFAPARVFPYHYRGPDGLADVDRFKELVESENTDIEVILLDWYLGQ